MNSGPMNLALRNWGLMNLALTNNEACDLSYREGCDVQRVRKNSLCRPVLKGCGFQPRRKLLMSQKSLGLAEKLEFWVAQRFNAAICPPFSAWASAPEVLSLSSLAHHLVAAVTSPTFLSATACLSLRSPRKWENAFSHIRLRKCEPTVNECPLVENPNLTHASRPSLLEIQHMVFPS